MYIHHSATHIEEGEDFVAKDLAAARVETARRIRLLIDTQLTHGQGPDGQFVRLYDARKHLVAVISFQDVLYGPS